MLDVKDDNPTPKGQLAVFNRSILILTPQRALKFTAINADRHYLWLTALSFLAHSQQDVPDIPTPVPSKAPEFELSPQQSKTRRPRIRDSIRLAKSQNPIFRHDPPPRQSGVLSPTASLQGAPRGAFSDRAISPMPSIPDIPDIPPSLVPSYRSQPPPAASVSAASNQSHPSSHNNANHQRDASDESAAMPPAIPRFGREQPGFHGRKRSNTGGRVPPPLSFRGFGPPPGHDPVDSHPMNAGSIDTYSGPRTADMAGEWSGRNSVASSWRGSVAGGNLFEAIGTMRMEAFISPLAYSRYESDGQLNYPDPMEDHRMRARKRTKEMRRRKSRSRSRSRNRESFSRGGVAAWKEEYWGNIERENGRGRMVADEESVRWRVRGNPFEGF